MKQNLQPPATPLEMLSLFFPAGLLDYFDLVNHVRGEKRCVSKFGRSENI